MTRLARALRKPPPGVLVVDLRAVTGLFAAVVDAAARAVRTFGQLLGIVPVDVEQLLRDRLGPGQQTTDGRWQSSMCASWLHDECQAGSMCDCTCHGGTLR